VGPDSRIASLPEIVGTALVITTAIDNKFLSHFISNLLTFYLASCIFYVPKLLGFQSGAGGCFNRFLGIRPCQVID